MKICICAHSSFNVPNHRLFFFAKELEKRGVNLTFVFPGAENMLSCRENFPDAEIKTLGINVNRFKKSKLWLYPVFAAKAKKYLEENFDIIYGVCLPAALAISCAKTSSKKIVDYLDLWSEYWLYSDSSLKGKLLYSLVKRAENYTFKKADTILTITEKMASQIAERGFKAEKIKIIRDGVDTKQFYPFKVKDAFYSKYNLDKKTEYVVFQGGIAAHDGVQFMIDAAPLILKNHPNVKFLIVGSGVYEKFLKEKVSKMKLSSSFIFTGWVDYREMPSFMNLAKINCVPLPNSPATHGVVTYKLFEAMACGVPTIIGAMPAVKDLIKGTNSACLVESEDKNNLAQGINALLDSRKLYSRIKSNGLKFVKNHDWRDIAKDMADCLGF